MQYAQKRTEIFGVVTGSLQKISMLILEICAIMLMAAGKPLYLWAKEQL